jgi:hypothetical protein
MPRSEATSRGPASSIAIGADGNPVLVYRHDLSFVPRLFAAFCNDRACLGSNEAEKQLIPVHGSGQTWNAVAIGPWGNPVAVTNRTAAGFILTICFDPECRATPVQKEPGPANAAIQASLAILPDGSPIVAYRDELDADLGLMACDTITCDSFTFRNEATPENDGYYPSIAIGSDGFPVVSYADAGNAELRVYDCDDARCLGGGEVSSVVHRGGFGYYTSLAIGRDGNPVISYWRGLLGGLGVARCNDPACSGGDETISVVDPDPGVGRYTSLAIGHDGNPVISYQDSGNGDLKIAHCNDPACAGGDEDLSTLDSAGSVGAFSSLAVGVDGIPVVSYADETNHDVKVIRALDAAS